MKSILPYLRNSNRLLLSDKPHICDFVIGSFYTDYVTNPMCYGREEFAKVLKMCPELKVFGENFKAHVAGYLASRAARP